MDFCAEYLFMNFDIVDEWSLRRSSLMNFGWSYEKSANYQQCFNEELNECAMAPEFTSS